MAVLILRERNGSIHQECEFISRMRIGSASDNEFCLPAELNVLAHHAAIARSTSFQVPVLVDLTGEVMPVHVNDRRVVQIKVLRHQDRIVIGLAHLEFWEVVMHKVATRSPLVGKRCLVCYGDVMIGDEVISCPRCQSPHHKDCWLYLATCAYYGCGYPIRDALRRVLAPTVRFERLDEGSDLVKGKKICQAGNPRDQSPFKQEDYVAFCPSCQTPFHAECWLLLQNCPICQLDVASIIRSVLDPTHPVSTAAKERSS